MPADSIFERRVAPDTEVISFSFEGEHVSARGGDSVAAALIEHGHLAVRSTPVSGAPRGAFCMMGACFECLVEIDGEANRQACMVAVREGMQVRRMQGARSVRDGPDVQ